MNAANSQELRFVSLRFTSEDTLTAALSQRIIGQLQATLSAGREATLVVSGGRSPVPLFRQLSATALDWSRVWITLVDERWVAPDDAASNERLVREHLLRGPAQRARFVGLKNDAPDPASGASRSFAALHSLPRPFDAVVLGMGEDGHFASLFPRSPGLSAALDVTRSPACVAMTAPVVPQARVSLNLAALLDSRLLLLPIMGTAKAAVLDRALAEGPPEELPVRAMLRQSRSPLEVYQFP